MICRARNRYLRLGPTSKLTFRVDEEGLSLPTCSWVFYRAQLRSSDIVVVKRLSVRRCERLFQISLQVCVGLKANGKSYQTVRDSESGSVRRIVAGV